MGLAHHEARLLRPEDRETDVLDIGQLTGSFSIGGGCIAGVEAGNLIAMVIADDGAPCAERAVIRNRHGITVNAVGAEMPSIVCLKI